MACTGMITISMCELDCLKVIEAVAEARLMPWRAAERLGLSRRQVERLVIRYRERGPAAWLRAGAGGQVTEEAPRGPRVAPADAD